MEKEFDLLKSQTKSNFVQEDSQVPKKRRTQEPRKKNIVIKTVIHTTDSDKPVTRSQVILNVNTRYKGKGKIKETHSVPVQKIKLYILFTDVRSFQTLNFKLTQPHTLLMLRCMQTLISQILMLQTLIIQNMMEWEELNILL